MRRIDDPGTNYEETVLYVVEVYYNSDDSTIIGWTEKESVWGTDMDELRNSLTWMIESLDKPILDEADLLQRMEELSAMGADTHDVGIPENGEISLGIKEDERQLGQWEAEGGSLGN